jgi:hypothetical protein
LSKEQDPKVTGEGRR